MTNALCHPELISTPTYFYTLAKDIISCNITLVAHVYVNAWATLMHCTKQVGHDLLQPNIGSKQIETHAPQEQKTDWKSPGMRQTLTIEIAMALVETPLETCLNFNMYTRVLQPVGLISFYILL